MRWIGILIPVYELGGSEGAFKMKGEIIEDSIISQLFERLTTLSTSLQTEIIVSIKLRLTLGTGGLDFCGYGVWYRL